MLSEAGVSTNRKGKFGADNGGDLHLDSPDEGEEQKELSSDSGHEQVASKWAQSVVSLAPFDEGDSIHPACTGIVFNHTKPRAYLLTPLCMFRSSEDHNEINYDMKTKVRLPDNQVISGILIFHDLTHNLAVVGALPEGGCVRAACLDHQQQLESHSQVVAVRRCFSSGKLIATTGLLAGDPMGAYCKEAAAGGILIDFLGNVLGLSCYGNEGTTFIPTSTMLEFLAGFQKACAEKRAKTADHRRRLVSRWEVPMKKYERKGKAIKLKKRSPSDMSRLEGSSRMEKKQFLCHYCDPEGLSAPGDRFRRLFPGLSWAALGDAAVSKEAARNMVRSRGYPFPVFDDCGMRLLFNFEDEFGEDIWNKLKNEVASDMSQSVVALASFSGDKRFFSCTGLVIGCNEFTTRVLTSASLVRNPDEEAKVADNLKIYDQLLTESHGEVVAIGRVYESGKLIATGGTLIDKPSELNCKELKMSTCKITKAGIGGPLVDSDGNFIGMDFYGLEETPYLPRNAVLEVLRGFDAKPDATVLINDHNANRWPVPRPCWCYPTWHTYMGEGVNVDHRLQPM